MRTAIVSDLHLGGLSGEDILRDPSIRETLLTEIAGADRVVLLGDVVELRELPLAAALEVARPFFNELGEALAGRQVLLVPGNHDHRLAEPLLERIGLGADGDLRLEHRTESDSEALRLIDRWLGDADLELAYPGVWLRDDVYATHGHYMDCHMSLPRLECLAAAAVARAAGPIPDPAAPDDYERVLRPVYGLAFGFAQSGLSRSVTRPSEQAWKTLSGHRLHGMGRARRAALGGALRVGVPAAVAGLNRVLRTDFDHDFSPAAITRGSVRAAVEVARRLQIDAAHVVTGHSHRAGPRDSDRNWTLDGGGTLHNAGNWVYASAIHGPDARPNPYWPGTVTWLVGDEPPRRVRLLDRRSGAELGAIAGKGHLRLASLASGSFG